MDDAVILPHPPGMDEKVLRATGTDSRQPAVTFSSESYQFLKHTLQALNMATKTQPRDPRREHLRRQAIIRRERVLERISATRLLVVGGVVSATCVMVGYLDASAHTRSSSTTSGSGSSLGSNASGAGSYGGSSNSGGSSNYGGGSSNSSGGSSNYGDDSSGQSLFGGGSPPSASSGSSGVVSGGS